MVQSKQKCNNKYLAVFYGLKLILLKRWLMLLLNKVCKTMQSEDTKYQSDDDDVQYLIK